MSVRYEEDKRAKKEERNRFCGDDIKRTGSGQTGSRVKKLRKTRAAKKRTRATKEKGQHVFVHALPEDNKTEHNRSRERTFRWKCLFKRHG